MLYQKILLILLLPAIIVLGSKCTPQNDSSNTIKNPYFGQTPPGDTAKIFAKDIISVKGRYEFGVSFSPNGKELLVGTQIGDTASIIYTKMSGDCWTKPEIISLTNGKFVSEMEAFFTPDGKHIYFAPFNEGLDVRLWAVDITSDGWENHRQLDSVVNTGPVFYPVCSLNKTLYYTNIPKRKTFIAVYENGHYLKPQPMGLSFGVHCFISSDESYALFNGRSKSIGKSDIYVAFKDAEGHWTEPINLGSRVNTEYSETCPALSHDGKYIFFSRYNDENERSDIYWVDAKIIEELKPKDL